MSTSTRDKVYSLAAKLLAEAIAEGKEVTEGLASHVMKEAYLLLTRGYKA